MFTLNEQEGYLPLLPHDEFQEAASAEFLEKVKFMVFSLEQGDQGTNHYQGYVEFKQAYTLTAVKRMLQSDTVHVERRAGTRMQAIEYCEKDPLEGPHYWKQALRGSGQGARMDLIAVKKDLDDGASMKRIAENHFSAFIRYSKAFAEYRRLRAEKRSWKMDIIVLVGPTGTGKSYWAHTTFPGAYHKPQGKWWPDYDGEETVIVDEMYGNRFSWGELLNLCDEYPMLIEAKGTHYQFRSRRIVFTSNAQPHLWYHFDGIPAWAESLLKRRITNYMLDQGEPGELVDWDTLFTPQEGSQEEGEHG